MEINIDNKILQRAILITGIDDTQELIKQALYSFVQQKILLDQALEDKEEDLEGLASENYLNSIQEARQNYKENKIYSINDI